MTRPATPYRHSRLVALDGLRGLAAMAVVAWHFLMGFLPERINHGQAAEHFVFAGTPLMGLINGVAAVTLFFTLSGFVLPFAFYQSGKREFLLRGAVKRWFRLVGVVLISVMTSYTLYAFGAYYFQDAGQLTGSTWLETSGTGKIVPSFFGALSKALMWVFIRGDNDYDTTLWTIKYEFLGSFLTFGFAALVINARAAVIVIMMIIAVLVFHLGIFYFTPFITGATVSLILSRYPIHLPNGVSIILMAAAFFLMGYFEPVGSYSFLGFLKDSDMERLRAYVFTFASLVMIVVIIANPAVSAFLASRLCQFLGTISFPMYAIHPLIYFSLTSWLYIKLHPLLPGELAPLVALALSLPVIVVLSYGLARCDKIWLRCLDQYLPRLHRTTLGQTLASTPSHSIISLDKQNELHLTIEGARENL